jgi:hypothetical protein
MSGSGITNPLRLDPRVTNRRYHFAKHLIAAPPGNKPGGSILAAKVAQFLTAVESRGAGFSATARSRSACVRFAAGRRRVARPNVARIAMLEPVMHF